MRSPPPTTETLMRHATRYLSRYAASAARLRAVLVRRIARAAGDEPPDGEQMAALVDAVVERLRRQGLLDDAAFARSRMARLVAKGQPAGRIRLDLARRDGIDAAEVGLADGLAALDPVAQATRWAERRRLGPFRRHPRPDRRSADIASMVRAGFSPQVAIAVIDGAGPRESG